MGNHGYDGLLENPYLNSFGYGGLPATAVDTRVQNVLELTNNGVSNYNGLTAAVKEQLGHGFSGQFSYTYSHALDNISNGGILPYSFNDSILFQIDPFSPTRLNYSNSDYDVRHSLNASYVWDLPVQFAESRAEFHRWRLDCVRNVLLPHWISVQRGGRNDHRKSARRREPTCKM